MHIPDGFLDTKTLAITNGVALGALYLAARRMHAAVSPSRIPLMGVLAAFAFTAQLLAFPVIGGTSTHIAGSVLLAVILGPYTAMLLLAAIVLLQALLFQHGGVLTFGANFLNIGIIGSWLGYLVYRLKRSHPMAGVAAFITVLLGGLAAALELAFSGRVPLQPALVGMGIAQIITGVIEGFVTVSILKVISAVRPDLLKLETV